MTTCMKEAANLRKQRKTVKPSKSTVQDIVKNIYSKFNEPFKNLCNTDLAEALTKVPEIGITKSKSKAQKKEGKTGHGKTL